MKERRVVLSRDLRLAIMGKADYEACCGRDLAECVGCARVADRRSQGMAS